MIRLEDVLADFVELVRIDSPTYGETATAEWLATRLGAIGVEAADDGSGEGIGGAAGNLIARVPGADAPPLLLNAHMDTVPPCQGIQPIVDGFMVRTDGSTILGGDDKAGCIAVLAAVREVVQSDLPHPPLDIVFTAAEEVGLEGAKALDYSQLQAQRGVVAESGTLGSITVAAPSAERWEATVHGKAAHAGVAPEQGINAIRIAAEAIASMRVGRLDGETTANVGLIDGGQARNVVPPQCHISGEARSHNEGKLTAQIEDVRRCFREAAERHGGECDLAVWRSYNAFRIEPGEWPLELVERAARDVGIEPRARPTGGGTDANVFNEHGIRCVAISTGPLEVHTTEEFVDVRDLHRACLWLARAIQIATDR